MRCSECNGHLYGCPYEDDDIQECDEAQALTRMTELAYRVGREDAIDEYFKEINRNGLITNDNNLIVASLIAEQIKEKKNERIGKS